MLEIFVGPSYFIRVASEGVSERLSASPRDPRGALAREIQRQYDLKCQEHQELIGIVLEYQRSNDAVEARLTMARAIGIERILPELKVRLERAQEMLMNVNECHIQEQAKLSLLEIEMETIKACMAMNESMGIDRNMD